MRTISRRFEAAATAVVEASRRLEAAADSGVHPSERQYQSLQGLLERLRTLDERGTATAPRSVAHGDVGKLGDQAIRAFAELSAAAAGLGLAEASLELEDLTLPMALWTARQGGEIRTLAPVVNALARLANTLRDPETLGQLFQLTGSLQTAVAAQAPGFEERNDPQHPWRLLVTNRAIIATRSHRPELIEEAYRHLAETLPEAASRFFAEGMQQMELLNYPQVVRRVVEKYHRLWSQPRTLH